MKRFLKRILNRKTLYALSDLRSRGLVGLSTLALRPPKSEVCVSERVFFSNGCHVFFGYYDTSPFSFKNDLLLACRTKEDLTNKTNLKRPLEIGFYLLGEKLPNFQSLSSTEAWCWQQGARLQWLTPHSGELIFNVKNERRYGSEVWNISERKLVRKYDDPIYAVCPDRSLALTLNFERLQRLRPGYGYSRFGDTTEGQPHPSDDGIFLIDLKSGQKKLIISLQTLAETMSKNISQSVDHYVNHLDFSPDGSRILFFHLWGSQNQRGSRVFTANVDGSRSFLLNDEGNTSHYCWKSNREVLLTYIPNGKSRPCYVLHTDLTNERKLIQHPRLTKDGHPSYLVDQNYLLTDSYPNKNRYQDLSIVNLSTKTTKTLGRFYRSFRYAGEWRCDLHPRLSEDNKFVCIDDVYRGFRAMRILEI